MNSAWISKWHWKQVNGSRRGFAMNFPLPPPIATCLLPGPWQDSHPVAPACSGSFRWKRPWGLAGKRREISVWQSTQEAFPANSAPSMRGGLSAVLFIVEQEMSRRPARPRALTATSLGVVHLFIGSFCRSGLREQALSGEIVQVAISSRDGRS